MTQKRRWLRAMGRLGVCACLLSRASLRAQNDKSPAELQRQLDSMQTLLQMAEKQIDEDHANLRQLREQLEALQKQVNAAPVAAAGGSAADLQQAVAVLQEQQALNQSEIQVHEQEKVESASKYSLKLRGLVLFNGAVNNGAFDQPVLPLIAIPPGGTAANGSLNATGQQTFLGLDAAGPELWGARTYASLEMDFSGGLYPYGYPSYGNLFHLRTATMQLAWPDTTLQAGVAPLILTPEYATSYFSIAEPAMSWSGALWGWLPQLSVEHRFALANHQELSLQGALADIPDAGAYATSGLGAVSAAERSRYPGSEVRAAWHGGARGDETIGVGGYWSPHSYPALGEINAWAGTVDWKTLLPARLQLSGEAYRGSALGGLSAGAFKDDIQIYNDPGSPQPKRLSGLHDAGGWAQLKFSPLERLEFNLAFGLDNVDSRQLGYADLDSTSPYLGLARNQTTFGNIIFRPTSTIILSGEYRRIRSWQVVGPADTASRFGLAAGYAF